MRSIVTLVFNLELGFLLIRSSTVFASYASSCRLRVLMHFSLLLTYIWYPVFLEDLLLILPCNHALQQSCFEVIRIFQI